MKESDTSGINGVGLPGKQQRPTATTNIRKSGSHGNLAHRSGSASSDKAKVKHACRCHERNQLDTQLETQYLRNLQQQIYFLELENSYLKQGGKGQSSVFQPQNEPADFERKAAPNTSNTIRRLETKKTGKERAHSFHVVDREKQLIVSRLKDTEDSYVREKRLLSEEIVELQKRLDDVTPELAKKEAQIARLEDELQSAHSKLRASNSHAESLKVQLEQKDREEILLKELEDERRSEVEQLTRNIRALEMEMNDYRSKENRLQDEVTAARRQIREEELKAKKEKELGDKILQDNDSLIRENSRLSVELSRVESAQDRYRETSSTSRTSEFALSELAEVRENEMITRSDLLKTREMLRSEQMTIRQLENQLKERDSTEQQTRDARSRMQKEFDSLQALSRNLSAENQALRKEKVAMTERIDDMSKKLAHKDVEVLSIRERLESIEKQYRRLLRRYEHESALQTEKSREFEQLAQRVKDLSASLRPSRQAPPHLPFSPTETTTSEREDRDTLVEMAQTRATYSNLE